VIRCATNRPTRSRKSSFACMEAEKRKAGLFHKPALHQLLNMAA
jgi:hypothetical protein